MTKDYNFDKVAAALKALVEPLGIKPRAFVLDYCDDDNHYFNTSIMCIVPPGIDDITIAASLIEDAEAKGYTIIAIHEILDGYSYSGFEELAARNRTEALKHMRVLYLDKNAIGKESGSNERNN